MKNQYHLEKGRSFGSAFRAYLADLVRRMDVGDVSSNAVSLARTAVLTYAVPGLGGPVRAGKRTTTRDIETATEFLDSLSLDHVRNVSQAQDRYFKQVQVPADVRKTNRYQAKLFSNWVTDQGLIVGDGQETNEPAKPAAKIYRHSSRDAHAQGKPRTRDIRLTERIRRDDFGLRSEEVNAELSQQMAALAQFEKNYLGHRLVTVNNYASFIYRVLGWQYHFKRVPLEELSLKGIIPYVPLRVSLEEIQTKHSDPEEVMTKFLLRQQMAKQMAEQKALEAERLIEDYCAFYQDSPRTQVTTIQALIVVAKFFYFRDTGNTTSRSGYSDIPMVCRLRQKMSAVNKICKSKPKAIPYAKRSVPWETIPEVFKKQQEKVENAYYSQVFERKKGPPKVSRQRREPSAIAVDLQKLLVLGFFCFLPPDRNRTVSELEVNRTLVRGTFKNGILIPMEDMASPEKAKWFINLGPEDYKTGPVYQEYCAPVDDIQLTNGKTFYGYIQLWLDDYRPLFKPNHNRLFVKVKTTMGATPGEPITYRNMTSWVKYLFVKYTGVPVVPQSLRKMYVTFLKNSNASEAELEAAARAMHHSRAMQAAQYDEQELQDKLAPILAFNQRLLSQAFDASDKQALPLTADGQLKLCDLSDGQLKELMQFLRAEHRRRSQGKVA
ncbi:hypothetical protein H6F75_27400 [Nodosilinea sp. FACHB-131]|uniref:hypothetical protein n=1 Tax=Cyanophyceae TaxID=3028117 RepID=UPI001684FB76|nr:hypothetical protein [Nodosilinea sp. FACHB-131]MBD1877214.1 hypothetical protein [Nodosilinea sp. FACHB-131]